VKGKPSTGLAIDWNTIFTVADGTSAKLGSIAGDFRDEIIRNLQKIKFSKLSATAAQNEFMKIPGLNAYVFQQ